MKHERATKQTALERAIKIALDSYDTSKRLNSEREISAMATEPTTPTECSKPFAQASGSVLPCPFCGCRHKSGMVGWDHATRMTGVRRYYYRCFSCGTLGPEAGSQAEALNAWNLRAPNTELSDRHQTPP